MPQPRGASGRGRTVQAPRSSSFILYEVARDDSGYIMDTFRAWKGKEEKLFGEYRTKRVILEMYDDMVRAIESGREYRTHLEPKSADLTVAPATGARLAAGRLGAAFLCSLVVFCLQPASLLSWSCVPCNRQAFQGLPVVRIRERLRDVSPCGWRHSPLQ